MSKVETMRRSSDSQHQQQTIQSIQQLQEALSSLDEAKIRALIELLNQSAQELPDQIRQSSKQVLTHYESEIQKSIQLQKRAFDSMTPESMIQQMQPLAEMQAELIAREIMPICQSITTLTQAAESVMGSMKKQVAEAESLSNQATAEMSRLPSSIQKVVDQASLLKWLVISQVMITATSLAGLTWLVLRQI